MEKYFTTKLGSWVMASPRMTEVLLLDSSRDAEVPEMAADNKRSRAADALLLFIELGEDGVRMNLITSPTRASAP